MDYGRPGLVDRLAAEYVAGTLRGGARRRFEALLPAHPALRAATEAWAARLLPLTGTLTPVAPSPGLWRRIERQLGFGPAAGAAGATGATGAGAAAGAGTPGAVGAAAAGIGRALAWWRALAGVASLAALVLAVALVMPQPVRPPVVVVLAPAGPAPGGGPVTNAAFVASVSGDGRAMVTRPVSAVALAPDRALELWSLPKPVGTAPAGPPRSLGLIRADGATVVQRGPVLDDTDAFAVSLEPSGGSPTGAPTGPVLYVGKLGS